MNTNKEKNIYTDLLEMLPGIPVEPEYKEPWRKACYSCSAAGLIKKKFDLLQMRTVYEGLAKSNVIHSSY